MAHEPSELSLAQSRITALEARIREYEQRLSVLNEENLRLTSENDRLNRDATTWKHQAEHDLLTGLLRRGVFVRKVSNILRGRRHNELPSSCFALFDVDDFKPINDRFGHPVGDEVLRAIAGVILEEIREDDLACRMGDEYFIFFNRASRVDAERVSKRIADKVKTLRFGRSDEQGEATTSVSYGVVQRDDRVTTYAELYDAADRVMYVMKADKGRH